MAYTKTEWVNDVTALNADNMNNIENGIYNLQPNEITAYLSADCTLADENSQYQVVPLDECVNVGDKFTLATTTTAATGDVIGVRIPSGVTKIKISATGSFVNNNNTSEMYFVLYLQRVRDGVAKIISRQVSATTPKGQIASVTISPFNYADVVEGDIFYLRTYKSIKTGVADIKGGNEEFRTYLTIEAKEQA